MKKENEIRACLKTFIEMVKLAKLSNNPEFNRVVEDFKTELIRRNLCSVKEETALLDKILDEIIENKNL